MDIPRAPQPRGFQQRPARLDFARDPLWDQPDPEPEHDDEEQEDDDGLGE
ncbi:TPA: hypothetical protein OUB83_000557 [Pseudomonas aeruginosa]|nr:hypothetical protein [Pseudomonas aeruginosa]